MPNIPNDLRGLRSGRLLVIEQANGRLHGGLLWRCRCDCGNEKVVGATFLRRRAATKSCGCLLQEGGKTTHGLSQDPLYDVWRGMMSRCYRPDDTFYHRYGGRGVIVCERWKDVAAFVSDNAAMYKDGLFIDRIDNNGPYSPRNCRWVDAKTQANNKSNNRRIAALGKELTVAEWSRETGLHRRTITSRLDFLGWSADEALTTPSQRQRSLATRT